MSKLARVVSMPSRDLFERQDESYREHVLPEAVKARVLVEAASALSWDHYFGRHGEIIAMRSFGLSTPGKAVEKIRLRHHPCARRGPPTAAPA